MLRFLFVIFPIQLLAVILLGAFSLAVWENPGGGTAPASPPGAAGTSGLGGPAAAPIQEGQDVALGVSGWGGDLGGAECLAQNRDTQDPKRRLSSRRESVCLGDNVPARGLGAVVLLSEFMNSWDGCTVVITITRSLFLQRLGEETMIHEK